MLKETHVQAWMVVHALINGYGKTQPGCRDDLLAFLFQLSYCKVPGSLCACFTVSRLRCCRLFAQVSSVRACVRVGMLLFYFIHSNRASRR